MSLTHERLRELFSYNPETGLMTRLKPTAHRTKTGDVITRVEPLGYTVVQIDKKIYKVHRLAWLYMTGEWPKEIDHINGIRNDNRWCNLRKATRSQNQINGRIRSNNKTGYKGVSIQSGKYLAVLYVNKKAIRLGTFDTAELASEAYLSAAKMHYGEFVRSS
jgi:hypothetical protein